MPTLMEFGKYRGKNKSVDQILLENPSYFLWVRDQASYVPRDIRQRIQEVSNAANNFISPLHCSQCEGNAAYASIYHTQYGTSADRQHIYDSRDCFEQDQTVTGELNKIRFVPLTLDGVLMGTRGDQKQLMKFLAECMGMRSGRRTKEYLEEFIK